MPHTSTFPSSTAPLVSHPPAPDLAAEIEHLAHLLPSQGPITVFVHHNTLHAFEEQPFHEAVVAAADLFDCHPYLPEAEYRAQLDRGRIRPADLDRELLAVLGDQGDELLGALGTRHALWLAMLERPLWEGPDAEIRWYIDETESLFRYRPEVETATRERVVSQTRRWVVRDYANGARERCPLKQEVDALIERFGGAIFESWNAGDWEPFTLHLLWRACRAGVDLAAESRPPRAARSGDRDREAAALVDSEMIRFCAAYLDQGLAPWRLPDCEQGLLRAFVNLHRGSKPQTAWLHGLPALVQEVDALGCDAQASIAASLAELRVTPDDRERVLTEALLELPGWAGMVWQMETNAEWTVRPAPRGTLVDYVAVRLLLQRLAKQRLDADPLSGRTPDPQGGESRLQQAFSVFQIAQVRGWTPVDLMSLSAYEWRNLIEEVDAFSSRERRRVYHQAYERQLRERTLDAIRAHAAGLKHAPALAAPEFQLVCCIDDREESFRRHLEEVFPACETFGFAGFFGVAMYYRGVSEATYRPLCPVNVKPQHFVRETPAYSAEGTSRRQEKARQTLGRAAHGMNQGSQSFLGGAIAGLLGAAATLPMVLRILSPRLAGRFASFFGRIVVPNRTQLTLERTAQSPGSAPDELGYSIDEMTSIVHGTLTAMGLTRGFARLVIITGHGSSSVNNPHSAAYDCGACGGGRGGPNARAFARMANDPRVRERLAGRGMQIDQATCFIGGYHNTGDDSYTLYDLDLLPTTHRGVLNRASKAIDEARARDAHERCRRFESAPLSLSPAAALRHVEGRASDLSQVRIECGHATNAYTFVGRRAWSRGLFLDRRAFLASYDPEADDKARSVLAKLLSAVIPVCAGIALEYYFSRVDNRGYGCGTKLPHNVTSMLGVMDGAGSDLRTGLPWQMVEIHEPVRNLFVIETTPEAMQRIMADNAAIDTLVQNDWVQLALFDAESLEMKLFQNGRFEPYQAPLSQLPRVAESIEWYRGQRDHLGFATIDPAAESTSTGATR
ncbi:hypothetical protein Pla175_36520 [Pirellulimonas nuda]|uniref:Probable inorganic carbon transporter subunit DabA n=1 Tax=Pirellulimonas nuda TaxID=2528009 RepID=A0A518DFK0_9BACT|nr:DUF2309 domain-containing protein [Pirellulimonas nuda]QDU90250.1 hypothetical protein Pla175_36520 [Pirellulimonas nuda]